MKKLLFTLSFVCGVFAMADAQTGEFKIESKIGGLKDGSKVVLRNVEEESRGGDTIAATTVSGGRFCLSGSVVSPTLSRVEIIVEKLYEDGTPYDAETSTVLMLENANYTIEADDVSQMPLVWEFQKSPLTKEMNVRVLGGGQAEEEYREYRTKLHPLELAAWKEEEQARKWMFMEKNTNEDSVKHYQALQRNAEAVADAERERFLKERPAYSISMHCMEQKMKECFALTGAEVDEMLAAASATKDVARLEKLKAAAEHAKKFARLTKYTDFEALTEANDTVRAAGSVKSDRFTLIDFWASWCGPCRAAIPHVKELYEKYGEKLTVLSVSVDKDEKAWRKALDEEKMPWAQLLASKSGVRTLQKAYQLTSIPYMLVLDKEGRILCATHDPDTVSAVLKSGIKE